jgi:hypothetical protein
MRLTAAPLRSFPSATRSGSDSMRATNERMLQQVPPTRRHACFTLLIKIPVAMFFIVTLFYSPSCPCPQLFGTLFNAQVLTNAPVANIGQTFIYKVLPPPCISHSPSPRLPPPPAAGCLRQRQHRGDGGRPRQGLCLADGQVCATVPDPDPALALLQRA